MPDIINPCWHKITCRGCDKVELTDRPKLCSLLKCKFYTPCPQCSQNRELNPESGLCDTCVASGKPKRQVANPSAPINHQLPAELTDAEAELSPVKSTQVITPPGVPHPSYSEEEREWYRMAWEQYSGFFRDPSAYALIHKMIMLEVELLVISNKRVLMRDGGDDAALKNMEMREQALINNIGNIRKQLPQKESQELTDDEKSIAMIHERYIEVRKTRYRNGVSRIISPEAIALAPVLPFKLDLRRILTNLGYNLVLVEEAVAKMLPGKDLPTNPTELAEFLGMMVRERIAITDSDDEGPPLLPEELEDAELT